MTVHFAAVPPVDAEEDLSAGIGRWTASPPMRALVEAFDGDWSAITGAPGGPVGALAALIAFAERWKRRRGRERNLADELAMTPDQAEVVLASAEALGLCAASPPRHTDYDHVLILGGLIRACLTRPEHAARLIRTGAVRAKSVTAIGAHRLFGGDEARVAAQAGLPGLADEYEALDAGTRRAFGLGQPDLVEGETRAPVSGTWGIQRYRTDDGTPVAVVAAPSGDPLRRRANTPETLIWFAERVETLRPGQRVLIVTTPIYVPAQHAAALRTLRLAHRVAVDTVGRDPQFVKDFLTQQLTATKYLHEIRSALWALHELFLALEEPEPGTL